MYGLPGINVSVCQTSWELTRNDELAHSSIRFTIGRFTTLEEIDYTIELVRAAVEKLRELSPLWDMYKDGVDLNSVEWVAH